MLADLKPSYCFLTTTKTKKHPTAAATLNTTHFLAEPVLQERLDVRLPEVLRQFRLEPSPHEPEGELVYPFAGHVRGKRLLGLLANAHVKLRWRSSSVTSVSGVASSSKGEHTGQKGCQDIDVEPELHTSLEG